MAIDLSGLDAAGVARMAELERLVNAEIRKGCLHVVEEHSMPAMVMGEGLCEEGVMIVCGKNVWARICALQEQARELHAEGVARVAINKASGT